MSVKSTLSRLVLVAIALEAVAPLVALARSGGGSCAGGCGVITGTGGPWQGFAALGMQPTPSVVVPAVLIGELTGAVQKPRDPGQASGSSAYYGPAPSGSGSNGAGHPAKN